MDNFNLPITNIHVLHVRHVDRPDDTPLGIYEDPEPGWSRTFSRRGIQRFQTEWIMANSREGDDRDKLWLTRELEAKGYTVIYREGDQDEQSFS
jgi:hypothetical protein